jgi:hypothetical protein
MYILTREALGQNPGCELVSEMRPATRRRTRLGHMEAWDLGQVLPAPSRLAPALVLDQFDFDKPDLKPFHLPPLKSLAASLVRRPPPLVHIVGHTDRVGTPAYNFGLGMRRAPEVIRVLRWEMKNLSPAVAGAVIEAGISNAILPPTGSSTRGDSRDSPFTSGCAKDACSSSLCA